MQTAYVTLLGHHRLMMITHTLIYLVVSLLLAWTTFLSSIMYAYLSK